jgi:putative protein-disulfide isomerase
MRKYKILLYLGFLWICPFLIHAQDNCPIKKVTLLPSNDADRQALVGTVFPTITVKNLAEKNIILPQEAADKPTFVCVLMKDEGRAVAASWTKSILAKYPNEAVNVYEISLLPKGLKILRGTIEKGMKKAVDTDFHNNYTTFFGDIKPYKTSLKIIDDNSCYVYLLDKTGKIQGSADGFYTKEKGDPLCAKEGETPAPMPVKNALQKDTITYVFDPICGFCYAFEPEMKKLEAKYKDKYVFEIISGGMVIGDQEGEIGKVAPHISYGYKELEKMSDARFGDAFLIKIMKVGTYHLSSEMPSIALEVFKSMKPDQAISFANDVQMMLYYDGISLNEPENYAPVVKKYGIDPTDFVAKMKLPEWKTKTYQQFAVVEKLGVSSFPTLIFKHDRKADIINAGFAKFEKLVKMYPFK